MCPLKSCTDTLPGAPETHRGRDLQTLHLQVPQSADIWSMGCVSSEVATWVCEGYPKLLEYRRRRKQEILKKSKTVDEDCFHYLSEVLETVTQIHFDIEENSRRNDYITPRVIRGLVNGMIRPDPRSRGSALHLLKTSVDILKDAKADLKRALPGSSAPSLEHTVSETFIDRRMPRLPPNFPPDRGHQVPARPSDSGKNVARPLQAAELHNSPPKSVRQDPNRLPQGLAVRNLADYSDQQGGEPVGVHSNYFTAQDEEPPAHRPSPRIASHPAASNVQSQQQRRAFTSTAGIAGPFPNSRPIGISVDGYDATDASFLPRQPRHYRAMNNDLSASRAGLNDNISGFANSEPADLANSNNTSFQNHQPTLPDPPTPSPVGRQSAPHQRPHPTMSVKEGLTLKKAKRWSRAKYPGEDMFHTMHDILKNRDHVRESTVFYLSRELTTSLGFPHR